ncbi:MAG: hypothetical protein ACKVI3_00425 [Verrucomicrobiia bacterium]|tara:strand:+ start:4145 stop:4426 length:282 start_codon:yes stop_codon:yes gene_type:complete
MKSAYELAMERLEESDPSGNPSLTDEQKAKLAEIDQVFQGKIAEREIFLKQKLEDALVAQNLEEMEQIQAQIGSERARLEEEREDEKNRLRES